MIPSPSSPDYALFFLGFSQESGGNVPPEAVWYLPKTPVALQATSIDSLPTLLNLLFP